MEIIRLSKPDLAVTEFDTEAELIAQFCEDTHYTEPTAIKNLFHVFTGETKYFQNTKWAYCLRSTN